MQKDNLDLDPMENDEDTKARMTTPRIDLNKLQKRLRD